MKQAKGCSSKGIDMRKNIQMVQLFIVMIFLSACTNSAIQRYQTIGDCLHAKGARVEQVGDSIHLLIPANALFAPRTARLISSRYNSISCIAEWLRYRPDSSVLILSHSDELPTAQSNQTLSEQRGEGIKNYLWRRRTGTSLISAVGKGESGTADYALGKRYIEIVLRDELR